MDFNSLLKETDIPLLNNDTIPLEERKKNLINYAKMGYLVLNNSKIALNNDDNYIKLLDSKINLIQNDISNYNEKVCVLDKNLDILTPLAPNEFRSNSNIVFDFKDKHKTDLFLKKSYKDGFLGLNGHRSVGGIRVSNYNSITEAMVNNLLTYIEDFILD